MSNLPVGARAGADDLEAELRTIATPDRAEHEKA
jgi:hypothetical protein